MPAIIRFSVALTASLVTFACADAHSREDAGVDAGECSADYSTARELFPDHEPSDPISSWTDEDVRTWCEWRRATVGADEVTCADGRTFYAGVDMCIAGWRRPDPSSPHYCDPTIGDTIECARQGMMACLGGESSECACSRLGCE